AVDGHRRRDDPEPLLGRDVGGRAAPLLHAGGRSVTAVRLRGQGQLRRGGGGRNRLLGGLAMAARSGFTPLTPERQEEFLSRHIPYRLHALDLGVMVSDYLFRRIDPSQPSAIQIGPLSISAVSGRLFTNAAVEHAMMSCRAMMECLGLKEIHSKLVDDRGQRPNTVTLEHFGLSPLTADEAIAYLNDPAQVDGLIQTFHSATLA